jgi:mono/diheme cytochrome c family protein
VIKAFCFWTAASFAAVTMAVSAQTPTPTATPQQNAGVDRAPIDQAQIDLGKVTYAQKCSHCHGPNMVSGGTIAPDLRRFPDDRERFFTTVKLGRNGKMPPWGDLLNDEQIATLWAFAASRRTP